MRKKTSRKKKPFGGTVISFEGREDSMEKVFGKKPITPAQMTKTIWSYVKRRHLMFKAK